MLGKTKRSPQKNMFGPHLVDFIDMGHELVLLANKIDQDHFEESFSGLYPEIGRPSMPVRLMVGSLMLKRIYNLGEGTLAQAWERDPYMQYFCGMAHFEFSFPTDARDLVYFRERIGESGVQTVFAYSASFHGKAAKEKMVLSDTTVQENNTTFPTDAKLVKKIIDRANAIAEKEGVRQRQNYKRVSKQLVRDTYNPDTIPSRGKGRGPHRERSRPQPAGCSGSWT